jgi:hypothetical protein
MSSLLAPEPGRMTANAPVTARGCDSFRGALRHGFHACEHVDCHCGECEHLHSHTSSLSGDSIGTSLALDAIWLRQCRLDAIWTIVKVRRNLSAAAAAAAAVTAMSAVMSAVAKCIAACASTSAATGATSISAALICCQGELLCAALVPIDRPHSSALYPQLTLVPVDRFGSSGALAKPLWGSRAPEPGQRSSAVLKGVHQRQSHLRDREHPEFIRDHQRLSEVITEAITPAGSRASRADRSWAR